MLLLVALLHLAVADPTAHVAQGGLRGVALSEGGAVFRGVPYARPPVGDLRWRDPLPPEPWVGTRDATAFAPACSQAGVSMPTEAPTPTGEDCLYLNIWVPEARGAGPLPVIVWIPGGGFTNGATAAPVYDGANLARRGAVVVTVGYRLGILGFLAHPELTAESAEGGSGNYGLMDQVAALEWVRDNIAAFGGDPAAVTLAGQSAGATSVSILMAAPRAQGLFHRAIGQSGGLFEPLALAPHYQLSAAEAKGAAFAQSVGAATIADLRDLPAERLTGTPADRGAHPVIEPRVLPRSPFDVFRAKAQARVPLLVGFNADEARSLARFDDVADLDAEVRRRWGPLPSALVDPYRGEDAGRALADFERDLRFGWNIWAWARLQAAGDDAVFLYRFDRVPPAPADATEAAWGAGHFVDLWYMFDNLDQRDWAWTGADRALARFMADAWVRFAATGDPNPTGAAAWPRVAGDAGPALILDAEPHADDLPGRPALAVFDAVYDALRPSVPAVQPSPPRED